MTAADLATAAVVVSAIYWLESGISALRGYRGIPGLLGIEPLRNEATASERRLYG